MNGTEGSWEETIQKWHENAFSRVVNVSPEKLEQIRGLIDHFVENGVSLHEARAALQLQASDETPPGSGRGLENIVVASEELQKLPWSKGFCSCADLLEQ